MTQPVYTWSYENLAFTRDGDGVLVLRFHTNGGPVVFTGRTHEDLPAALEQTLRALSLAGVCKPATLGVERVLYAGETYVRAACKATCKPR